MRAKNPYFEHFSNPRIVGVLRFGYCLASISVRIFIIVRHQILILFLVDEALGSKLGLDFVTHSLRIRNDNFEYFIGEERDSTIPYQPLAPKT